jgi:hypothetical protein
MWQSFQNKELQFGTKDLATSAWRISRSWRIWLNGMNLKEVPLDHLCETCIEGKHQRTYFPKDEVTRALKLLELVQSDVCGSMKTTFHGGTQNFVPLIDDILRKIHVYLLK